MAQNKIINKRLLPKTLVIGLLSIALAGSVGYISTKEILDAEYKGTAATFGIALTLLSIITLCAPLINAHKKHYAAASAVAYKYIRQEMQNHPELMHFAQVLENPQAMQNIATFISNNLTESEQKRVLDIISEMTKYYYPSAKVALVAMTNAQNQIISVINEHATNHPDFIRDILIVMSRADSIYVTPAQQHTR